MSRYAGAGVHLSGTWQVASIVVVGAGVQAVVGDRSTICIPSTLVRASLLGFMSCLSLPVRRTPSTGFELNQSIYIYKILRLTETEPAISSQAQINHRKDESSEDVVWVQHRRCQFFNLFRNLE